MPVAGNFIKSVKKILGNYSPEVILDVGTRDLEESIQLSQAFPDARIIAFEPNPKQFQYCQELSKNYPNIEVHEYACSDEESIVDFWIVNENQGASSMLEPIEINAGWQYGYRSCTWDKISGIRARRIDNVLRELGVGRVDIVWMDVQGVELKALKGMGTYIDHIKIIHAEAALRPFYKGHILKNELEEWLNQHDYNTEVFDLQAVIDHPHGESDLVCIKKYLIETEKQ